MGENKTTGLATGISAGERAKLLKKWQGNKKPVVSSRESDKKAEEKEKTQALDARFAKLPWYTRFSCRVGCLFHKGSAAEIYEERRVVSLGKQIQAAAPDIFHYKDQMLLVGFYNLLTGLKDAAQFFFSVLDTGFNQDKFGPHVFLGTLASGNFHARLLANTTPEAIAKNNRNIPAPELRSVVFKQVDNFFDLIPEQERNAMNDKAHSLFYLKEISSFPFDRFLRSFKPSKIGKQTCNAAGVREMLISLNNILFSLKEPPPLSLFESLFVFQLRNNNPENSSDIAREAKQLVVKAEESLSAIGKFNKKVPLTKIIRFVCKDLTFVPKELPCGDDWSSMYREYWKRQIESGLSDHIRQRKQGELQDMFQAVLKGSDLKVLKNAASDANPNGFPLNEGHTLAFLRTFFSISGLKSDTALQTVLLDGDFIRRDNHIAFTGAYDTLMKIEEDVAKLDAKISPEGDLGSRYARVCGEKSPVSPTGANQKQIQAIQAEASQEARGIITRTTAAFMVIVEAFAGILKKGKGGRFDTLNNLEKLVSRNESLVSGMLDVTKRFQQVLQILNELEL